MFLYISLPSSSTQQREMTKIQGFWENVSNLNAVPINLVPGYFAHIVQV